MGTKTVFLNENEKKENIYKLIGGKKKSNEKYIEIIAAKAYNNKIGYFQFFDKKSEMYYKVYIMPKIHRVSYYCVDYQKQFINFFKHYYRLVGKYEEINKFSLGGNISDLSYKSEDSAKELVTRLAPIWNNSKMLKIGHNLKFDMHFLAKYGAKI